MAEAEDVITDVARHATIYIRDLWRRNQLEPNQSVQAALADAPWRLDALTRRLDLLIVAVFGTSYPIRIAQPPAPATLLARLSLRRDGPRRLRAVPGTDGRSIWLPAQ